MAICRRCGKALPAPSGTLNVFANRGAFWLIVPTVTVSLWAVVLVAGMMTSFFEGNSPYAWKLDLMLAFGAIVVLVIVFSMARALEARRLALNCSDCAAILTAQKLSSPEEFGAHKVRVKKG
jgi:hypothetical protein